MSDKILYTFKESATQTLQAMQDERGQWVRTTVYNPNGKESMQFNTRYFKPECSAVDALKQIEKEAVA